MTLAADLFSESEALALDASLRREGADSALANACLVEGACTSEDSCLSDVALADGPDVFGRTARLRVSLSVGILPVNPGE